MNVQSPATASSKSSSSSTCGPAWGSWGAQQHKGNLKEMKENISIPERTKARVKQAY